MAFVVDASVAASWLLPDEYDSRAATAFQKLDTEEAAAPSLWWFEIRNLFIINERRGRVDPEKTRAGLALLAGLPIRLDRAADEAALLTLARKHRLTVYDAAYLELAQRLGLALATLDGELAAAARAEALVLI